MSAPVTGQTSGFLEFGVAFEHALDAVVAMNLKGEITGWNPAASTLFGWSQAEALGKLMGDLIVPAAYREAHAKGLAHYLETGEGPVLSQRINITAVNRSGSEFPVELSVVPIPADRAEMFIGFLRSRAAEAEAEREREDRTKIAEILASVAAAQLQGMAAHDFVQLCLEKICAATGWSAGHLYLIDSSEGPLELVPTGNWYLTDESMSVLREETARHTFGKGEGLPGRVWEAGTTVFLDDLTQSDFFLRRKVFTNAGICKAFAFPIFDSNGFIGVAEFFGSESARSDDQMRLFVETAASHVSMAIQRNRMAEYEQALLRETKHRITNSFTVLTSILRQCASSSSSAEELFETFEPRLRAIAQAHSLHHAAGHSQPLLRSAVERVLDLFPDRTRIEIDGPEFRLLPHLIEPLSLVLGELTTNSLKHGIWHDVGGTLSVTWRMNDERTLELEWRETPVRRPEREPRSGYGTTLLDIMIRQTMNGSFSHEFSEDQFSFTMTIPAVGTDG